MPKWGLSMKTGKIVEWFVAEGDTIAKGDDLVDIETDKIAGTLESPVAGPAAADRRRARGRPAGRRGAGGASPRPRCPTPRSTRWSRRPRRRSSPASWRAGRAAAPQLVEVGGRHDLLPDAGARRSRPVIRWCSCTASAGTRTPGCSCSSRCPRTHTVHALDLPGHGASSKDVGDGSLTTLADTVVGFLDALGISRAHLVGHSLGGAVVAAVAKAAPDRVASLTLLAPAGLRPPRPTRSTCAGSPRRRRGGSSSRCSGGCSPTSRWSPGSWSTTCCSTSGSSGVRLS